MRKIETRKDIAVKKRTLVIILVILAVLAALWFTRQETIHTGAEEPTAQVTSCLIALDEVQQQVAASAAAQEATPQPESAQQTAAPAQAEATIDEFGAYTSKDDVCAYLIAYGHLPENFMTKNDARDLGWSGGGLDDYAYGKCIGGDRFGNYEGLLPESGGRDYTECDIDTLHKDSRGAKRIVFSNDGLIYYTDDHYESFTLLYGEP